eukprot:gb/GECG01014581.1/.p1 GENE.gb/GECG01014581.1/~~gb/GECG01014581.1/.p1  ORF type:complete len:318 (+),score=30.93 gb/GECG01014581.1/:1-954(+)
MSRRKRVASESSSDEADDIVECGGSTDAPTSVDAKRRQRRRNGEKDTGNEFVDKLWRMVEDQSLPCISWSNDGKTFIIDPVQEFIAMAIPRYFSHKGIQAFQRQLRYYEFYSCTRFVRAFESVNEYHSPSRGRKRGKCNAKSDRLAYSHPFFKRDQPLLRRKIVRRTRKRESCALREQRKAREEAQRHVNQFSALTQEAKFSLTPDTPAYASVSATKTKLNPLMHSFSVYSRSATFKNGASRSTMVGMAVTRYLKGVAGELLCSYSPSNFFLIRRNQFSEPDPRAVGKQSNPSHPWHCRTLHSINNSQPIFKDELLV